ARRQAELVRQCVSALNNLRDAHFAGALWLEDDLPLVQRVAIERDLAGQDLSLGAAARAGSQHRDGDQDRTAVGRAGSQSMDLRRAVPDSFPLRVEIACHTASST